MHRHLKRLVVLGMVGLAVASLMFLGRPAVALANSYDGSAAANYADTWWSTYNPAYPSFSDDCTNFVSQALFAGGLPQIVDYNVRLGIWEMTANNYYWYLHDGSAYSYSWTVAQDLYEHLVTYGYGALVQTVPGTDLNEWSGVSKGDPIFFDWTSDGTIDHTVIQVGYGYDTYYPWYYGNYVDSHTNNRYHAFWDLYPENSHRATTTVYLVNMTY